MLRCLTAGESHGKGLLAIIEGMPAGLKVDVSDINKELKRRQAGFGRGKRMQIEHDTALILSGFKGGVSLGSPIALLINNKDYKIELLHKVHAPRPGHADLAGYLKYGFEDIRQVLERASARSTAQTVSIGAVAKVFLKEFGISVESSVLSIGGENTKAGMTKRITEAITTGDTVGGVFEVVAKGVPVGLGSYVQPDRRLDARLAAAIIAIPGVKSFEIGLGLGYSVSFGSEVHDQIYHHKQEGYFRNTNNAGGIEGGISNGQEIILRGCMKPIATLMNPLDSIDVRTRRKTRAATERSDTCVVEAAGVVGESAMAFVLADALLEKFGGDSLRDTRKAFTHYTARIK
jgi:chorismate synthase